MMTKYWNCHYEIQQRLAEATDADIEEILCNYYGGESGHRKSQELRYPISVYLYPATMVDTDADVALVPIIDDQENVCSTVY